MKYLKLKFLLMFFALAMAIPPAWAGTVIDEITVQKTGIDLSSSAYQNFTGIQGASGATYAGKIARGDSSTDPSIQLKKSQDAGIVTTASNGKAKSIIIKFKKTDSRTVEIWGKNTAYNGMSDLDYSTLKGTLITSIGSYNNDGNSIALDLNGDYYTYIAIVPTGSNAIYIDKITIVWETEGGDTPANPWINVTPDPLNIDDDGGVFTASCANMPDNGLGVSVDSSSPSNEFSFTKTNDNTFNEGDKYFPLTNHALESGTVQVNYTGHALSAAGVIKFESTPESTTADVKYLYDGDIYIVGDVVGSGWSTEGGTVHGVPLVKNADGTYSVTVTATAGGEGFTWLYFTKSLNASNYDDLGYNRFGPAGDYGSWSYNSGLNGVYCDLDTEGNLHTIKMSPGNYIFTIDPANNKFKIEEVAGPKIYNKVTDASQLIAGKKYILVYEKTPAFMGAISTTNTKYGLSITGPVLDGSSVNIGQYGDIRELTLSGDENGWSFHNGDGYLYWNGGNTLNVTDAISDNHSKWTVSSSEDGFILTNLYNTSPSRVLKYNPSSPRFACYDNGMQPAVLYVEDGVEPSVLPTVATPTFTPAAGTYTEVQNVEINCTTEDATIYYTTDGTVPTTASAVYSTAIPVNENKTIKAFAVKEGMQNSAVAEATYTINLPITVSTLAAANALEDDTEFTFTENDVVVTFKQSYETTNNNGTVTHTLIGLRDKSENKADGKGGSVFFDISSTIANNLTQGTVLNPGWKAKVDIYKRWVELVGASNVTTQDETVMVNPFDRTGVTLTDANQSEYVILNNVTISNSGKTATTTGDAKATYTLYDQFKLGYEDGNYEYVKGVVCVYNSTIEVLPLELKKAKVAAGLSYGEEPVAVTAKIGEDVTEPELTNPNHLTVTYTSSDTNVATVDAEGNVTAVGAGEATITATFAGDDNYLPGEASYIITVNKKDATLSFGETKAFTVYVNSDFEAPELKTTPADLTPIVYSIEGNDDEIVLFDDEDGTVVIGNKTGTVTITASFAGNNEYNKASDSYTITVKAKEVATLSFDVEGITVYPNAEDFNQPKLTTTPENLTVTYTSTDDNIATVVDGVLMIGDKIGTATITATFAGNDTYGTATASYTVTVEPRPIVVADEGVEFELYVGQTQTKTFDVTGDNLKGDITLTLNDETSFYSIEPTTIPMDDAENATVTVTYAPTTEGIHEATVTLSTKDAEENVTVTLTGMAEVQPVVAMPTFSLVAGTYGKAQQLTISAENGANILYSTDGSEPTTPYNGAIDLGQGTTTVKAVATKDGFAKSPVVTATYIIDIPKELSTITPFKGYYQIKNNGNGKYANIAGRKTLNFTDAPADKAGTVIWLETNDKGQVQSIRSQAADLQGYANRAMRYVPQMVDIVVNKINQMEGIEDATGAGSVLGENGLGEIMEAFNEGFDHHLYVEQAQGGWRLYGKTPSMQHVVDFYREHKSQVEAKLPKLEQFINDALDKLINKIGGSTVFTDFSLHQIWEKMGGTLTEPVDDASIMAFYREVLNNKNYVWDFAYQTAQIYWGNVKNHPRYDELKAQLGDYADYIDEFVTQVRPDFKYYVIQRGDEPDYISEGNGEIINNDPRTLWTLEPRTDFTVNIAGEQFGCPYAGGVGGYATTNYTDFAYTVPESVTAYKVASVENGVANLQALSGVIPAQTPVLLMAKEAKDYVLTLSTEAGTAVEGNLLVGPDYLIKTYELKTPMVESLFSLAKGVLGEQLYNQYVAQYEYLQLLYAGTVNNKYFWGLTRDDVMKCLNANGDDCVVRDLSGSKFIDNRQVKTNKAFLVSETDQTITISTLRGDVNHDGYVNIDDITALIDYLLEVDGRACPYCANVNCDSTVNIVDVTYLIDILLGNISPYAEGGNGN